MRIAIDFDKAPRKGRTAMLVRVHFDDKTDIDKAADQLSMSTNEFVRTIIVQATRTILAEGSHGNKTKN